MFKKFSNKRGFVLYLILPLMGILAFGLILGINYILYSHGQGLREYYKQQAFDVAQSGINHTLYWFQSRTEQPVTVFNPDSTFSEDPSVGLVGTVEISGNNLIKGRYVVDSSLAKDISTKMAIATAGVVWEIHSKGIVYIERDTTKAYNQSPNEILKEIELITEFKRMNITPPTNAALCVDTGRDISVSDTSKLKWIWVYGGGGVVGSGNIGIAYKNKPPPRRKPRGGRKVWVPDMSLDVYYIFGFPQSMLRTMADYRIETVDDLPDTIPAYSFIYGDSSLTFTDSRPLEGSGVLFVDGNLVVDYSSGSSYWAGFVYVTDTVYLGPGLVLEGGIVVPKGGILNGEANRYLTIAYSPDMLSLVGQYVGSYRVSQPNLVEY